MLGQTRSEDFEPRFRDPTIGTISTAVIDNGLLMQNHTFAVSDVALSKFQVGGM